MAFLKIALIIAVVLFVSSEAYLKRETKKRSVAGQESSKKGQEGQDSSKKEPEWKPVTGTREFTVDVQDNIQGANQHRHEKWNNGTVEGSYAAPGRDGKWLKYNYIGDAKGFRITNTQEITPEELMQGHKAAKDHEANIDIKTDDSHQQYTVTEEQLKAKVNKTVADNKKSNQ